MTLCPYKWALYMGSLLTLLWVAVGLWMQWQTVSANDDAVAARARVKAAAAAADGDTDDEVDSDDGGTVLVAVQ